MNSWSKIASLCALATCICAGQTVPADNSPAPASSSAAPQPAGSAATGAPAAVAPPACPSGSTWFCVTQALQRVLFNADGSRRSDAEIAADAGRVIADLTKQGVLKPQDAPAKPIKSFDDANKYVNNFPMDPADTAASTPVVKAPAAPAAGPGCPPDRPWLCPGAPSAPAAQAGQAPAQQASKAAETVPTTPAAVDDSKTPPAPKKSAPPRPAASAAAPPAGTAEPASGGEPPLYVLGANDVVQVTVFDERNVNGTYAIGPDGRISMPLIGTFRVVGYTIPELTELITQKLRDDGGILEPVVNVQLLRSNSKQYTIIGGLGRTGPVPLLRDTTILDAIAAAGGFREFANKKDVVIRRGTKDFHFNYNEVLKGRNLKQNIPIEDGDLIIVKE